MCTNHGGGSFGDLVPTSLIALPPSTRYTGRRSHRSRSSSTQSVGLPYRAQVRSACDPRDREPLPRQLRTTVGHLTERADGSFVFHYTETGTYHVDFVDPTIPDQDSQFTGSETVTLTPGGTFVDAYMWHDFPTGIKIWERYQLTEVDGTPVVERYILDVTGCPS